MGCDKNIAKRAGIEDCVEDIVNHNEDIGDQVVNKLVDCGVCVWTMKWQITSMVAIVIQNL